MPSDEAHEQCQLPAGRHDHDGNLPRSTQTFTKRILAHRVLTWTTLILAMVAYVLTSLYAWYPQSISRNETFGGSPSRALRVLTVLSTLANYILAATVSQSFDLMWGMLLARKKALSLLSGLALQPGTGLDGHLEIIFNKQKLGVKPRAWSLLKILSMTIIPILGIVILSMFSFSA